MNARRLVIPAVLAAVALAAVALAAAVSAAPVSAAVSPPGVSAAVTPTDQFPANLDYDNTGGYGVYNPAALTDSWVQGVVINLNWSTVQIEDCTSASCFNWTNLDDTANAWANAGKHIVLVIRAANETGGATVNGSTCTADSEQILPSWEITLLGAKGTYCDADLETIVPDWFSGTFQNDFQTFVNAVGEHVSSESYYRSISYVRAGDGLGGEGFYLMPNNVGSGCDPNDPSMSVPPCQEDESADKTWVENNWHYTPLAWENFQETMLSAYHGDFPATSFGPAPPVIYAITQQDTITGDTYPVDYQVAKWATTTYSDIGIGQECIPPTSYATDYADINEITALVHKNDPGAYIQFQTCGVINGGTTDTSEVNDIITNAENHWGRSIEWYGADATNSDYTDAMNAYQTWVNNTFGG